MEEGRQALDGWRTAGPTSFGAALGPAAPENSPGGLMRRGVVTAGGDGVHSPSGERWTILIVGCPFGDRIRSGGEERSRFLAVRSLRNIHPFVVGQPVQIVTQEFATKPCGEAPEQPCGASRVAESLGRPGGQPAGCPSGRTTGASHDRHCLSHSKFSYLVQREPRLDPTRGPTVGVPSAGYVSRLL